jgi:phosphate/sulfate permease
MQGIAPEADREMIGRWREVLRRPTEYAPDWVLLAVSVALGVGTMVGWKRIVVTIGEKIGKTKRSYSQGAAAQVVAMAAGKSGLQMRMLRSIAMAWVFTLPAAMFLGVGLFFFFALLA